MTPTATAVSSPNPVVTPAAVTVPPRTAPASVAPIAPPMYRPVRYVPAAIPTRSGSIASKAAACRGAPASPIPNPTSASIRPSSSVEASGATSHSDRQPDDARQHADHGGPPAPDGIGHPAADGCRDGAQRRDAEQHEPARLGVPRLELLDEQRHEHQGAMEDHRRPEHPDHGRRERPRREQVRVDGRVLGPTLDQRRTPQGARPPRATAAAPTRRPPAREARAAARSGTRQGGRGPGGRSVVAPLGP